MVEHVCVIVFVSEEVEGQGGYNLHVHHDHLVGGVEVINHVLYLVIPVMVQETQVVVLVWDLVPTLHSMLILQVQIIHHHIHTVPVQFRHVLEYSSL